MTRTREWDRKDKTSIDAAFADVYDSLKGLAHAVRGGRGGETLNTTALVHEAFLKVSAAGTSTWKDESHFFALAGRAMRQILMDAARRELAQKRGGGQPRVITYEDADHVPAIRSAELIALDDALERLASIDPRRAQVVEYRIFAGLSTVETAKMLGMSTATVERDWRAARAWLLTEVLGDDSAVTR